MAHDVFISYSSLDKPAADAVCHGLESKGIRCWIAPRDQIAGQPYGEQITAAISAAQVMVLVFSDNVNKSHAVHNEVDLAAAANVTIVPFRITGVDFNPELRFYLGRVHWLDAFPQPVDHYIDDLAATVRRNLTERMPHGETAAPPPESVPPPPEPAAAPPPLVPPHAAAAAAPAGAAPAARPATNPLLIAGLVVGGVVGLVVIAAGLGSIHPGPAPIAASSSAAASEAPAAVAANPEQVHYYETVVVPNGPPAELDGATVIDTAQLQQSLNERAQGTNPFQLVDARGCTGEATIPGSICLATNSIEELMVKAPNKEEQIAFFCHDGRCAMSYDLAAKAVAAGYDNIFWYRGGINAWMAAGLPTTHFTAGPPDGD